MKELDNYCPHCGSQNVQIMEVNFEFFDDVSLELDNNPLENVQLEAENVLYYICGDCSSEWKPNKETYSLELEGSNYFN